MNIFLEEQKMGQMKCESCGAPIRGATNAVWECQYCGSLQHGLNNAVQATTCDYDLTVGKYYPKDEPPKIFGYDGSYSRGINYVEKTNTLVLFAYVETKDIPEYPDFKYSNRWERKWFGKDIFWYVGEGRTGDQRWKTQHSVYNTILGESLTNRTKIHLFINRIYNGEFVLAREYKKEDQPTEDQPDSTGKMRKVFLFPLQQKK
jgi:ribosomal protein L37AE/L43A